MEDNRLVTVLEPGTAMHISEDMDSLGRILEEEIQKWDYPEEEREGMLEKLRRFREARTNIVLVGATGCGKSSTINALFCCGGTACFNPSEYAKVGLTPDPETDAVEKFTNGGLTLWDTPGLGDNAEQDLRSREAIQSLLAETDEEGNALIDLVLVVVDASSKDLSTTYRILNDVIIPAVKDPSRILVALNQADIAMRNGRHWNYQEDCPDKKLQAFLEEKVRSVRERILEDTGVETDPIYYCAGCKDGDEMAVRPYNIAKLLYYIVRALPVEKRVPILEGLNGDREAFEHNDDEMDYGACVEESFFETLGDMIGDGMENGAELGGMLLGLPGRLAGGVIGGAVGTVGGCVIGVLNFLDELF